VKSFENCSNDISSSNTRPQAYAEGERKKKREKTFFTAASIFFFCSYPTVKVTRYFGIKVKSCKQKFHQILCINQKYQRQAPTVNCV